MLARLSELFGFTRPVKVQYNETGFDRFLTVWGMVLDFSSFLRLQDCREIVFNEVMWGSLTGFWQRLELSYRIRAARII